MRSRSEVDGGGRQPVKGGMTEKGMEPIHFLVLSVMASAAHVLLWSDRV